MLSVKFKLVSWQHSDDPAENDVLSFGPSDRAQAPGVAALGTFSVSLPKVESAVLELGATYVFTMAGE